MKTELSINFSSNFVHRMNNGCSLKESKKRRRLPILVCQIGDASNMYFGTFHKLMIVNKWLILLIKTPYLH